MPRKQKQRQIDVDVIELFVRQASALVAATAEVIGSDDVLGMEAYLYRTLAANCTAKAKLADGFAKSFAAESAKQGAADLKKAKALIRKHR
jgi:hypothetical protein